MSNVRVNTSVPLLVLFRNVFTLSYANYLFHNKHLHATTLPLSTGLGTYLNGGGGIKICAVTRHVLHTARLRYSDTLYGRGYPDTITPRDTFSICGKRIHGPWMLQIRRPGPESELSTEFDCNLVATCSQEEGRPKRMY